MSNDHLATAGGRQEEKASVMGLLKRIRLPGVTCTQTLEEWSPGNNVVLSTTMPVELFQTLRFF